MLTSDGVTLRLLGPDDVAVFHARMQDLSHRGRWFPLGLESRSSFERGFAEHGYWSEHEGMLAIEVDGAVVGEIEFFPLSTYLTGYELSYLIFGEEHRGRGYTSTAVRLLTTYLFATRRIGRLQLIIHPDNAASRRVAERCGYEREGLLRACWFNRGAFHDVEVWSVTGPLAEIRPSDVHHPTDNEEAIT